MRKLLISSAVLVALAAAPAAFAADKAMAAKPATPSAASKGKRADCEKQWKAQKTHTQTRKAFVAACLKG